MNKKSWIVFGVIVAIVVGGMAYLSTQERLNIDDISNDQLSKVIAAEDRNGNIADHTYGNADAKVVIVEYGDYQCPGCSAAAPKALELTKKYQDNVLLIFRNFPIATSHPNARAAAAAAEAAGLQGKFWEMNELIYQKQDEWKLASVSDRDGFFQRYAEELGLDITAFNEAVKSTAVKKKIDFDLAVGRKQNVSATPSFYVNGKNVEMDSDGSIEKSVKAALKEAGVAVEE